MCPYIRPRAIRNFKIFLLSVLVHEFHYILLTIISHLIYLRRNLYCIYFLTNANLQLCENKQSATSRPRAHQERRPLRSRSSKNNQRTPLRRGLFCGELIATSHETSYVPPSIVYPSHAYTPALWQCWHDPASFAHCACRRRLIIDQWQSYGAKHVE